MRPELGGTSGRYAISEPSLIDPDDTASYNQSAGWSSPVARWAHNPKVVGSNPTPATNQI